MLAAAALATAAFQLPHGGLPAGARHRAPRPALGFFEDMKRGFDAGMDPKKRMNGMAPAEAPAPAGDGGQAEPSFFDAVKKMLINAAPTEEERLEERKRAGEGPDTLSFCTLIETRAARRARACVCLQLPPLRH